MIASYDVSMRNNIYIKLRNNVPSFLRFFLNNSPTLMFRHDSQCSHTGYVQIGFGYHLRPILRYFTCLSNDTTNTVLTEVSSIFSFVAKYSITAPIVITNRITPAMVMVFEFANMYTAHHTVYEYMEIFKELINASNFSEYVFCKNII